MPVTIEDNAIIERIRKGDVNAFAVLVDRYKDKVFSLVCGIVRSREIAEEIAQDVFVKAYHSLNKFRMEASFSTWIYRIAYNTAISETRKRKLEFVTLEEQYHHPQPLMRDEIELVEEQHLQLNRAILLLSAEEQLILQLYYREERSVDDVSLCLNLSVANVKVKLFRLRNKLREMMEKVTKVSYCF